MTAASGSLLLYRELLRLTRQLPRETRSYYARYVRQTFNNFLNEEDPQRVQQLAARAREDAKWVLNKYSKLQQKQ